MYLWSNISVMPVLCSMLWSKHCAQNYASMVYLSLFWGKGEVFKCASNIKKNNVYLYLLSHILATFHFNFKW